MPQYVCEFCKTPIIDINTGTYHLVKAWVKTGNNSNARHVEKLHLYAHSICAETSKSSMNQQNANDVSLF